jgi:SAM-dependent methyltransferase
MCQAAATHTDPSRVVVGDAVNLPLDDASADCAVAFMSLQDIDDMPGAIKEIARVLRDGKQLALAIVHPMYSGGGFLAAGETPDDDFIIKRPYFKPEVCTSTDKLGSVTVTFYREHRPLQTYVHALLEAGFNIEQLHEVTDEDEGKPWHQIPMFLDILATRQPRIRATRSARQPGNTHRIVSRWIWRHGHDHRVGTRNSVRYRHACPPRNEASSTQSMLAAYVTAFVSLSLSGLILVASSLAAAYLSISH